MQELEEITPEWVRLPGAGRIIGMPPETLRDVIKAGELPASFVKGVYYVRVTDLRAYMEKHLVKPTKVASRWCWVSHVIRRRSSMMMTWRAR